VADNWDWKTLTLDRPEEWPQRWGPETTDTDEFMRFSRAVGAEPIFVCNFAKAISGPGLREAVRDAAEWVEYCNQTKGYNVKYWEIGNETYLQHNKKTTTTAEAYAEGLAAFSRAMKAVDPTIQIGANGPSSPESPGKKGAVPWWPVVWDRAIEHMDFLIIHEYYTLHNYPTYRLGGHEFGLGAQSLRDYLRKHYPARAEMPIAITEWNVNQGWRKESGDFIGHAVIVANILGDFARAGVDMAAFWPLRSLKGDCDRALLECEAKCPTATYHAFKAFGTMCRGALVESSCEGPALVYAARSGDGESLNVFVINPLLDPVECRLTIDGFEPAPEATLHMLSGPNVDASNRDAPDTVVLNSSSLKAGRKMILQAPGPSLCVIELRSNLPSVRVGHSAASTGYGAESSS
jgi:alpha-L-arabinofuranosidase